MIRLQFVLGDAFSSRAIAWFSAGRLSHVDAILPDGRLLGARSDAADGKKGVQIRRANYEKWASRVVIEVPTNRSQEQAFYAFLMNQVGKPYDHMAIWGFVLNRAWREDDAWICSELQAAAMEEAGILPELYSKVSKISPQMLAVVATAIGGKEF